MSTPRNLGVRLGGGPCGSVAIWALLLAVCGGEEVGDRPGSAASRPDSVVSSAAVRDLLTAESDGLVAVRYVPQDSRSAQIIVRNPGDQPLTLRMPRAFVGVPVLAQFGGGMGGMGGGMGGMGGGMGGGGGQMTGGGMGGMGGGMGGMGGGMGGMGGMGMGGGFCWVAREVYGAHDPRWVEFRDWLASDAPGWLHGIYRDHGAEFAGWIHDRPAAKWIVRGAMEAALAGRDSSPGGGGLLQVPDRRPTAVEPGVFTVHPGQTRRFRFATVCLEYGKPEPSPRMTYRMMALETVAGDPRLAVILAALGNGAVSQKVAQAAAWHVANGMTWQRLAAETIRNVGVPPEPFFQPAELNAAVHLVQVAEAAAVPPPASGSTGR